MNDENLLKQLDEFVSEHMRADHKTAGECLSKKDDIGANWWGGRWNGLSLVKDWIAEKRS
jgi:hypothetical protein